MWMVRVGVSNGCKAQRRMESLAACLAARVNLGHLICSRHIKRVHRENTVPRRQDHQKHLLIGLPLFFMSTCEETLSILFLILIITITDWMLLIIDNLVTLR